MEVTVKLIKLSSLSILTILALSILLSGCKTREKDAVHNDVEASIMPEASVTPVEVKATQRVKKSLVSEGNNYRIKKVLDKMKNGEKTTIAYLGGSITEGYLVNSNQNFAIKTTKYLQQKYQNTNIERINAGLSGTSSTIGLLRVKKDVLSYSPDIVIIEFAVNDSNDAVSKMAYESLVTECLNSESKPAVILLFTVTKAGYTCEEHMKKVGEAFELPMISIKQAIGPEIEAGKMTWEDYASDEAHPTKDGHEFITECLSYYFDVAGANNTDDTETDYANVRAYGAPYASLTFYNSTNLYPNSLGGFLEGNSNVTHFPNGWIWGKEEADSFRFTMEGRNLFLLYKEDNNENMGCIEVYIDGKKKETVNANTKAGWNNPQVVTLLNDVTAGKHEVELRVTSDTQAKNFHILGFGTTGTIESKERIIPELLPYTERAVLNTGNTYRLEELMKRAEAGEKLTIGFIGGSITMGSGASSYDNCYARKIYDWWSSNFKESTFELVNAGIGATTSQFACARVKEDLLSKNPDFVIVEFSVNDEGTAKYGETYESLLRMILESESKPTVIVLNMVQYNNGNNAQNRHNEIAKAYDLPIISMKESIYQEILNGNLTALDVSADNLHPNDRGHALAAEIVTSFLDKIAKNEITSKDVIYEIPVETQSLTSINSYRYDSRNSKPKLSGFEKDATKQNGITDVFKNGYSAKNVGDSIKFNVTGSSISLQYKKSNRLNAPKAIAIIDGDESNAIDLDGNYPNGWGDWLYLHDLKDKLKNETHSVEIRITEAGENPFYLVSVITAE